MKTKLNGEEMMVFCSQMAVILHSGISPLEGISMMQEDLENENGKEILQKVYEEMELGQGLYEGMKKTEVFPVYACQMVRLGEISGRLDEVMQSLADYYKQEEELYKTVRHAVSYPLFMLAMMLGVLGVLMVKVMPVFQEVFLSLGVQMDGPAGAVLQVGLSIGRYSWLLLGGLGAAMIGMIWVLRTSKGRAAAAARLKKNRWTERYFQKLGQYRLAYGMSMSLKSGLDPQRSLELMRELIEEEQMAGKISGCIERMQEGCFFEEAIAEAGIFDRMSNRMIRIGQRSGALDQVLEEIAKQCNQQASESVWNKISVIEPTVVILLAILVGLILLSVMIPLMNIMTQIG